MTTSEKASKKKKKKLSGWWIVFFLAVLVAGFFVGRQMVTRRQTEQAISQLETTPYKRDTLDSTINGSGTVRAKQSAQIPWQATGYVAEIGLKVGDEVKAGDLLLSLDKNRLPAEMLQAELNKLNAESNLANLEADTDLQRAKLNSDIASVNKNLSDLAEQKEALSLRVCTQERIDNLQSLYDDALSTYENWPTQARWLAVENARQNLAFCDPEKIEAEMDAFDKQIALLDETLAKYQADLAKIQNGPDQDLKNQLQLQLDLAIKQLSYMEIRAPFSGRVTAINHQMGDFVSPGALALQMADLSELYMDVPVSEVDIPQIRVGQSAELIFDAFFEERYQGVVTEIANVPNAMSGVVNYMVTIAMQNGIDKVKPGMTAGVNILTESRENTYVVPAESVFTREGKTYVYVRREGRPVMVEVRIGAYSNKLVEILQADIKDGEPVYISPPVNMIENFMNMGGPRGR